MNNAQLDARLRAANPFPVDSLPSVGRPSSVSRIGQIAIAIVVAMSIGVGAAWAAGGTNFLTTIFPDDLKVGNSDVGFESFSSLKPTTPRALERLPGVVVDRAMLRTVGETAVGNEMAGRLAFGHEKKAFNPDSALISAFAHSETNLGTPAILLVVNNEICSFTGAVSFSDSNCSRPEDVANGAAVSWRSEEENSALYRVTGLFDDQVAAIDVLEDTKPPIEITDNVLELRNIRSHEITVVGIDDEGKELFRTKSP